MAKETTQTVYTVCFKYRFLDVKDLDDRPYFRWVRTIEHATSWTRFEDARRMLNTVRFLIGPDQVHLASIVSRVRPLK